MICLRVIIACERANSERRSAKTTTKNDKQAAEMSRTILAQKADLQRVYLAKVARVFLSNHLVWSMAGKLQRNVK